MKIAYIAHPISGDVPGNLEKIRQIVRRINLEEPRVVPFAPYWVDCHALVDTVPAERVRGIKNNYEYFRRGVIDELRVYGDKISPGIQGEIDAARKHNIPIVYYCGDQTPVHDNGSTSDAIQLAFEIRIDHISRQYETAKDGVYKSDMKAALDGLQEIRNIACETLQQNTALLKRVEFLSRAVNSQAT